MIIIADSGSSKTDWRLITKGGDIEKVTTLGLNPHIISETGFRKEIKQSGLKDWPANSIEKVYFYGAGITGRKLQENIANWLRSIFQGAEIMAESDLLAAARAVYATDEGIIGILGTGSNSGYYNGSEIKQNIPALGYMLGDEGSGNALGKHLIVSFLRDELSGAHANELKSFYPDHKNLLNNIYSSPQPARLLASFVPFIHQHHEDPFFTQLVEEEFTKYFRLLRRYENISKVGLVGSVAYYFSNILHQVAAVEGIKLHKVLKSPIEVLTLHHQAEIS
jgi:glucosamine kinase